MNKLLSLVFALGITCVTTAHAMPIALLGSVPTGVIQVGHRCSLNIPGVPFDGCGPAYVPGGYYGNYYRGYRFGYYEDYREGYYRGYHDGTADFPYVHLSGEDGAIEVDKGPCGFGSYLSCVDGTCWRLCY